MGKGLIIGIVAVVIALSGVVLLASQIRKADTDTQETVNTTNGNSAPTSFGELMRMTTNQTCTFNDEGGNAGTVYVGGGKVRGDFSSASTENSLIHMIADNSDVYIWFEEAAEAEGYKISLANVGQFSDFGEDGQNLVDFNQKVEFSCSPWSVDNSMFTLPDIKFTDFGQLQALPEMGNSGDDNADVKELQCQACESLPSEAAASCRQALGC